MFTDGVFPHGTAPARWPSRFVEGKEKMLKAKKDREKKLGGKSVAEINGLAKIQIEDALKEQHYQEAYNLALDLIVDLCTPSSLNESYKDKADLISRIRYQAEVAGIILR